LEIGTSVNDFGTRIAYYLEMKLLRRIISGLLVTAILISSIGFTVVSFACPKMSAQKSASCLSCRSTEAKSAKMKDCCKPIVEHKVVRSEGMRPHDAQRVQAIQAVLPTPLFLIANANDLFAIAAQTFDFHTTPLPPDASTARAMLSTFLI
jgi:hypothetical protein